jgi:hypothetical protein
MEYNTFEVAVVKEAVVQAEVVQLDELAELQLALVGGGIGDPLAA